MTVGAAGAHDPPWVRRTAIELRPDPDRVVTQLFLPGQELTASGESRAAGILERVLALDDAAVERELNALRADFGHRHRDLEAIWEAHLDVALAGNPGAAGLGSSRRRLAGACFTREYAVQSVGLFNPSIVAHPNQSGLPTSATRFVMTLRGVGEGHVSSIELRTGVVDAAGVVALDPSPAYARAPAPAETHHRRDADGVARRSYDITFPPATPLTERVLTPQIPTESHGMEDLRLVRLVEPGGSTTYAGTYTAYDGRDITMQLLRTPDLARFSSRPIDGPGARNKGMALFPRQVAGRYVALSRADRESNAITTSSDLLWWDAPVIIQHPEHGWELVQLGNCGSPIETDRGWLVLTHGVGAMRTYGIGALLLDLGDPTRVLGRLARPLLTAVGAERSGYVPNVVYSCGAMVHGRTLVLPYGTSDTTTRIAFVDLDLLLEALGASSAG